jgi:hypothetical protein
MARPFDAATLALLDGDALIERDLLVIDLPGDSFGFWNDVYAVEFPTIFPGVIFTGAASLIEITPATQTVQNIVQTMTATLSGLDTAALAGLWDIELHKARVTIAKALFDPVSRAVVNVITIFRGRIDRPELRESSEGGTGLEAKIITRLVVEFVSRAREMDRSGNRTRSFSDQARDFAGDRGFEFTPKTGTTPIKWGAGQSSGARRAGG